MIYWEGFIKHGEGEVFDEMKAEDEHQASSWTQFDPETGRCTLETSTLSLGILDQIESMTLFDLLEVINPDRGHCTCVGQAPSKGRRCQNPIAQHNRQSAFTLIDCLEQDYLDKNPKKKALQEIASLLLCVRYHRDQAEQVARKWHSRIDSSFSSTHTYKSSAPPRSSLRPCWSKKPTAPSTESFSWSTTHSSGSISFDNLPDEAYMYELLRNLYKQSKDRKQRQNPNAAFTNAEEGDQDIANDTPEMKREGQERRYESPRDHQPEARSGPNSSTFKKEEDDAAYNEYKKSRDRDDRNERIRQQARKAREEQERSKREKVEAEKQRWAQSWSLYTLRWDKLEGMHHPGPSFNGGLS